MSDIPTSEEIIEELTKDLEQSTVEDEFHDARKEILRDLDDSKLEDEFHDAEGDSESTEEKMKDLELDEETLQRLQSTWTEDDAEKNRQKSLELKKEGNTAFKEANLEESIRLYTEALNVCPLSCKNDRSVLYSNRAASKIKLEDNENAVLDCTKAIELDPKFVRPYLRRGKLYRELDKLQESLDDYQKVVELDPGNHEARAACVELPPIIQQKTEELKTEMLGKQLYF